MMKNRPQRPRSSVEGGSTTGIGVDGVHDRYCLVALARLRGGLPLHDGFVDRSISNRFPNTLLIFLTERFKAVVDVLDALDDPTFLGTGGKSNHGALGVVPRALLVLAVA